MLDEGMQRLLGYDGWRYWLPNGWSVLFRVRTVSPSAGRPFGIKYAFTLHDSDGSRLLGFDNAGPVPRYTRFDHRHPFRRVEEHVAYEFIDADTLVADFFAAVEAACRMEKVPFVIAAEDRIRPDEENDRETDRETDDDPTVH